MQTLLATGGGDLMQPWRRQAPFRGGEIPVIQPEIVGIALQGSAVGPHLCPISVKVDGRFRF